jgi:cytochrome c-type biogenesis protein CcmH/NrfG
MEGLQASLELIAHDTNHIKWLLVGVIVVFTMGLVGMTLLFYALKRMARFEGRATDFRKKAHHLLDKNDLDQVIKLTQDKIKTYPNDLYAHWFLAQAYYRKKEWHKALHEFHLIHEIAPSWRDDYVDPYIYAIREKLTNARPELVKE